MRLRGWSAALSLIVLGGVMIAMTGCSQAPPAGGPSSALAAQPTSAGPPASFTGLKKRLAVIRLENKVKTPLPDPSWQIGDGLTEMLTSELFKTGRFIMVERSALTDVVKEQELGQTGLVQKDTAVKVGELLGAQLLVAGAVTEFEANAGGGGAGIGAMGLNVGLRTNYAHVAVDIRLVDSATGQILKSQNADAKAQDTGIGLMAMKRGLQFGSDAFVKTPMGQATREAILKAVTFIVNEMEVVPWTARVVDVKDQDVYVNAGTNVNLKPGTTLAAYVKGDELKDPATGASLGSKDTLVGTVILTQIQDKFSIGTFEGTGALKRGDILRLK
jgi:curli biogenesis system outer membrane secretion channel CsgG